MLIVCREYNKMRSVTVEGSASRFVTLATHRARLILLVIREEGVGALHDNVSICATVIERVNAHTVQR